MEIKSNASSTSDEEALALVSDLDQIDLSKYRVLGGIVRYSQSARNQMKDVKQRIVASLTSRPYGCDNYLLWALPGSGKSFFVQEIAKSLGDAIHYREINLAQTDEAQFRQALSEIDHLDKPRLVFIDEIDSKPTEPWPYEALLPSLELPAGKVATRTCFVLAGSSGGSTIGMKDGMLKRPKGTDLLSRIPPGNEFEIEGLGLGDRLLVVSTQFLDAARDEGKEIHEVEKLVLYYVALNPRLKSARNIRQLAARCLERIPPGEDRIRYDHLFDPGDRENKEFWNRAGPQRNEFVDVFVSLSENDRIASITSSSATPKITVKAPSRPVASKIPLDRNRVAVMPLVNMISDPADEYFTDGMTEELISAVSLINELSVISRTSIMSYKKKPSKRIIDIGRELNVGTLLEGSVRKAGNRVRISVQLIDVESDKHLWAQNYDRNLEDVFTIQSDIAQKVAQSLESQLLPGRKHRIENVNSRIVDAHLLYLRGRDAFFKFTRGAFETALEYYEGAIEKDPRYALAYAGMAETYWLLGSFEYVIPNEAFSKTKEFANKALSLDNTLSEAHMALGFSLISADWNFDGGEKELRRSIELNPSASLPHAYLGLILACISERFAEAESESKIGFDLDPFSTLTCVWSGTSYIFTRNYDRAIEVLERALKLDPLNPLAIENLGLCWVQKGMFQKGIQEMERAAQIEAPNINPIDQLELAYAYSKAGYESKPLEILSLLLNGIDKHPNWALAVAGVYSVIGEKEKVFEWLEKAFKVRSGHLIYARLFPEFDNIRSDPRFLDLFVRVGTVKSSDVQKLLPTEASVSTKLDPKRIAVLPFTNISPDPKDEYFADGMTEELISTLSRIRELKVISRTSIMRYKQTEKSLSEIANDLKVNAVLEGSVRKMGDELRITAQLIDVQNDEHLWSEDYDRKFENIFSLQKEIAQKVADSLQVIILANESKELRKKPTQNMEAYSLFLKGRAYRHRFTLDSYKKGIQYCKNAVEKDPNFAQAHAEIARSYAWIGFWEFLPSKEVYPEAERFAERAIQLDPFIPESHLALGLVKFHYKWDFRGAEIEYRRALDLNPSLLEGRLELFNLLTKMRRFDEAVSECKRALELDPMSASTFTYAGVWLVLCRRYDEGEEVLKNAIELDPSAAIAHQMLGDVYVEKGQFEMGIAEIEKAIDLLDIKSSAKGDLAYACVKAGKIEQARKILDGLIVAGEEGHTSKISIAEVYASLGENDKALEWLEGAYTDHAGQLISINCFQEFDNLRLDPRFQALLMKIGFPDAN